MLCYEEMYVMSIVIFLGAWCGCWVYPNFYVVSFFGFMTVMKYTIRSVFLSYDVFRCAVRLPLTTFDLEEDLSDSNYPYYDIRRSLRGG